MGKNNYYYLMNLFSLTLVLIILFIVIYGCQFRIYKKKIEKFTDANPKNKDNNDDNNDNDKDDNNNDEDNDNNQKQKDEKRKESFKPLDDNEVKLLENFINEKINDKEVNELILRGEFTRENLENMINYIDDISKKNKN